MTRARRMAESTRRAILDRKSGAPGLPIEVNGVVVPSIGDAEVEVDGHAIALTNLDRVLWPAAGFTKADLVRTMLRLAPSMLPFLAERAITVGRFPGGVDGRGFAQAEVPGRPPWIRAEPIALVKGDVKRFTVVEERAALVWLAQMGVLELHTFLGVIADLTRPTHVLFDLDPMPPAELLEAAELALQLRELLGSAVANVSGSAGIHVRVPADGRSYADARAFAIDVAARIEHPLAARALERRGREGKVLVDTRQNSARLTCIVPYSLRTTPRPTIAMPVSWSEIERAVATRDSRVLVFEATRSDQ